MKKIILIVVGIIIFLGIVSPKTNKTTNTAIPTPTKTEKEQNSGKEQQQRDFLNLYKETIDIIYPIKKIFYSTNGLLTKVPTTTSYLNYKNAEEAYKNCSVYFTFASTPVNLKDFKDDFEQSFRELSIACTILQEDARYMADYINTNNMESYRKSQEELKQEPIKMISNAISRMVFGVGEKIGIDTKPLTDEFKEMSNRVIKEFEAEYGK